jgi:hypothetical protein
MKRWMRWGVFTLTVLALGGLASRVVISQQPPPQSLAVPTPTPAALAPLGTPANELWVPLRPHIEAVLGTRLEGMPQIRSVSPAQLLAVPDADLDAHLRWRFPHLRGDTLTANRQVARQVVASAQVAQHLEGSDVILVLPDAPPRIARWDESLAAADTPALLQLALVHETVRFLLDRRYNLGKLRAACRDGEEQQALLAVIEGYAQWVTHKVAIRLGCEATFPLLARRFQYVPDEAPDPGMRAVSQTALRDRQRAYLEGENFYGVLEEAHLTDIEAHVFARLPRQGRSIARPDLWLRALQKNRPDLASVLLSLESALPAAQWQTMQQTWTPAMLGQVAAMLGVPRERALQLEATWDEGRSLIWSHRQRPDQQVALSVVRHETSAAARAYFGFAIDLQRKQDSLTPGSCGPAICVAESQSTPVTLEGFDEAVRNDKKIQYGAGNEPIAVHLLLARACDLVVECTWYGANAEAGLAERLAQAVRAAAK